jgi:hypothetical protein
MDIRRYRGEARKINFVILTVPRNRRHGLLCRAIWKSSRVAGKQEVRKEGRA